MARKPQNKPAKKAQWLGYHRVNLSKADEAAFELWRVGETVRWEDIGILSNAGYKFSLSWDDYHQGISASLYCTQAKMDWAGYSLTAWAGDAESAVLLLLYKHYVMCEEEWDIALDRSENQGSSYG